MKTRMSPTWIPGLVLLMAWVPGGLAQNEIGRSPTSARAASATLTAVPAAPDAVPPATASPPDSRPQAVAGAPGNAAPQSEGLPSRVRLSPWTTEIVKLAQAGIQDSVMLSFIDNSGTFNLGADQIIYLSGLGVTTEVISAMLQHDAEVISGVRPLTISSEPAGAPSIQMTFAPSAAAPANVGRQLATTPVTVGLVNGPLAGVPDQDSLPEASHDVTNYGPSGLAFARTDEQGLVRPAALSEQRPTPAEKRRLYPVREPYPVPLLDPIIFVQAEERTPNILVIELFPRTDQ
jgi:hypothetical protein